MRNTLSWILLTLGVGGLTAHCLIVQDSARLDGTVTIGCVLCIVVSQFLEDL